MAQNKYKVIKKGWNGTKDAKKIIEKKAKKGWLLVSQFMTYYNQILVFKKEVSDLEEKIENLKKAEEKK